MDNDQLPSFPSFPARSVFPSGNYGSGGIGSGEFGGSWATAVAENSNGGKLFGGGSFSSSPGREQARLASAFAAVGSAPPQAPQPLALAFAPAPFLAPGHSHVSSPEIYRQFSPVFAAAAHAAQAQAPLQLPPLFGGGGGGSLGGSLDTLGSGGGSGPASPGFEEFMKQLATVRSAGSAGAISSGLDRSGALGSGGGGSGGGGGGEAASGGWKLFPSPSLIAPEATALEAAAAVLPPTRRSSRSRVLPNVGGAGALSSPLGDWGATFAARASSAAAAAAASEIDLLVPPFPQQQQQQQQRQQPAAAATPASSSRRPAPRRQRAILPTGPSPTKKEKKKGTAVAKKKKKRAPPPPRKKRVAVAAGVSGSGKKTSNFRGVSFHSRSGRFESHCWHRSYGRQRFLVSSRESFVFLFQESFGDDDGERKPTEINFLSTLSLFFLPPPQKNSPPPKKKSGRLRLRVGSRRGVRPRPALLPGRRRRQEAQLPRRALPSRAAREAFGAFGGRPRRGAESAGRGDAGGEGRGPVGGRGARREAGEAGRGGGDRESRSRGRGRGCDGGGSCCGGRGGGSPCCRCRSFCFASFRRQRWRSCSCWCH